MEVDRKKGVLKEYVNVMAPQIVGKKIYDTEILMRDFEYFATSIYIWGLGMTTIKAADHLYLVLG